MTRKFIIDTDTASDDAVAIMMAVQWPDVQVDALTTVSGNVPLAQCSINARYTLEVCGADIPVYDGCARPLLREPAHAQWFHGPDGMGGMNYPAPKAAPAEGHAVDELLRRFGAEPDAITLVTLGPLTNIALALRREPRLAEWVKECYMMGGAANTVGNVTPAAEYNIWCDPEAARMVFHSGMKITMIGWELCCDDAALDDAEIQHVYNLDTERAKVAMDCNMHALNVVRDLQKQPGLALADPVAMAVALDKTVATKRSTHYVDVSCEGLTRGMTVVDQLDVTGTPPYSDPHWADKTPNVEVCWALDVARWKEMLYSTLQ